MEISPLERVEAVFYTGEGMVSMRVWSFWGNPRSHLSLVCSHAKLTRTTEINLLEGELQQSVNAKFKVKHTQELKIWQGLDLKLSSTVTYETLQQLASQTEQARQEMLQIQQQKEEMDRSYEERLYSYDTTIKEKDSLIKQLEDSLDENKSRLICLDSRFQCMEQELKLKDDVCISLKGNLASSESEKNSLELTNKQHILEIEELCQDNKDLKKLLGNFVVKVTALDKELASVSSHVARLISSFERFYEMAQEEKMLMARSSKDQFEHLQIQHVDLMSESNALRTETEGLMSRLRELQRTQETMAQECQVAEEKIRRLESEATSNINLHEKLASELQGIIHRFLGDSKGEITNDPVNTLENQINLLRNVLDEEQLYRRAVEREKSLKDQKSHGEASLSATECQLSEAKNKYDLMLSKYMKELSRKHDQAINEIRKKYELEKVEITNAEKEKTEKLISETENKCNEKISQLKEEYDTMVERIQKDNEYNESNLWAYHKEELQRIRSQAENELRKQDDNIWDKRQLMYLFVLTSTVGLAFLLQPLLPADYSRWIIMTIAAVWGIGSIGFPIGLYGTTRYEKECSRHTGRVIYTVFAVFVIYGFYLLAMRTTDISDPMLYASIKEGDSSVDMITAGFWIIGLTVLIGNLYSSVMGCWTGGDRDP